MWVWLEWVWLQSLLCGCGLSKYDLNGRDISVSENTVQTLPKAVSSSSSKM